MQQKPKWNRSVFAGLLAIFLVVGLLLTFFILQKPKQEKENIVLPTAPPVPTAPTTPETPKDDPFVQVTPQNVLSLLETMDRRPPAYHQIYTVLTGGDQVQFSQTVELWVNSEFLHAEISDGRRTKTFLTDGQMVYIWYEGEEKVLSLNRDFTASTDELLALSSYTQLLMQEEQVTDADFLVLEEPPVQCVFVSSLDAQQRTKRYWIDVDTGLLFKADVLEDNKQVYSVTQERYELLALADETFQDRFLLPDGTNPFTAAEKTQQP